MYFKRETPDHPNGYNWVCFSSLPGPNCLGGLPISRRNLSFGTGIIDLRQTHYDSFIKRTPKVLHDFIKPAKHIWSSPLIYPSCSSTPNVHETGLTLSRPDGSRITQTLRPPPCWVSLRKELISLCLEAGHVALSVKKTEKTSSLGSQEIERNPETVAIYIYIYMNKPGPNPKTMLMSSSSTLHRRPN